MFRLKQRDPRWATTKIGESNSTVGRYGCTITSICMIHSKFYPKNFIKPDEAAKIWKFTNDGSILWNQSDFDGMEFLWRGYGNDPKTIASYARDRDTGVIVEVDHSHWCAVWAESIFGLVLFDPWTGKVLWHWKWHYNQITGYAAFKRN